MKGPYCVCNSPPTDPILSQSNPVLTLLPYFFKNHFQIILLPMFSGLLFNLSNYNFYLIAIIIFGKEYKL
jgi:hypothetical protein